MLEEKQRQGEKRNLIGAEEKQKKEEGNKGK